MEIWLVVAGIVAAYLFLAIAILWRARRLRREVAASGTWATAASRVVESRIHEIVATKGGNTFLPTVCYEYAVDGRTFRGGRLHFGDPIPFKFRKRADRRLAALTAAAAAQVYYDPSDPAQAVIERAAPVLRRDAIMLALLLAVLAGFLGFMVTVVPPP